MLLGFGQKKKGYAAAMGDLEGWLCRPPFLGASTRWSDGAAAGSDVLGRCSASLVTQHAIRQAVAVARLIGVPAPVHVRQVERPDGPHRTARREEFAD